MAVLGAGDQATTPQLAPAWRWGPNPPPPRVASQRLAAICVFAFFFHRTRREAFHFKRLKAIMGEPLSPRLKAKVVTALGEKHADKQDVVFAALRSDWVTCTASGPCAPAEALPRSFPRVLAAR